MVMLVPGIRLRYRFLRRKFLSWFRPLLALIMVGTATLGAGAAYWATQAEEESIILKQRLVVGRLQELAIWAQYAHEYATYSVLNNESVELKNLGLRLARNANRIRDVDPAEAARLDLLAEEEFTHARLYPIYYRFLKRPDDKLSIDEALSRDVSKELERFGFGVADATPEATPGKPQAAVEQANKNSAAPKLELKFWHLLDSRIQEAHRRVWHFSLAVVLYVSALVLFTFADLNLSFIRRACALSGAGLFMLIATAAYSIWVDPSFGILVGAIGLIATIVVWVASARGFFRSIVAEAEPLEPHDVDNKSYWGASLFLRHSHDATSRLGITLIAVSVLLSSLVGHLYVEASTTREELSHAALKNQVAFGSISTTSAATAMAGGLQPTISLLAKQVRCAAAMQQEFFPRPEAEKQVGEIGAVGVAIEKDDGVRVVTVSEDGAAAQAGVRARDVITHVDGEDLAYKPLNFAKGRLRGRIGSSVVLRIARDGAASPIDLTVVRGKITGEFTVLENGEAVIRNTKVACEEVNSEQLAKQQQFIQQGNYDGGYAPGEDLYYTTIYFSDRGNPARVYALADGYEELASLWNSKATVYLACLTLFAIALYLFGQALGVGTVWQAHTFLSCGAVLVTLSAGWAFVTWARSAEERPDIPAHCMKDLQVDALSPAEQLVEIAAYHYGQGEALFHIAHYPADYRKAADALDCAVIARPTFGRAQSLRASAFKSMDSSSQSDTYIPASSWSRTRDIIEARTQALKAFQSNNGAPSWITDANAFDELVLALTDGDRAALVSVIRMYAAQVATEQKREDADRDRTEVGIPVRYLYMNYGLALLADNRPTEAEAIYRHAINDLHAAKETQWVVEALTDLRMLATNCNHLHPVQTCADLNERVKKIKESIVAAEWRDKPIDEPLKLSDVSIQVTPYSAGWRAKLDATSAIGRHKMTVVWYMLDAASKDGRPEGKQLWRAIRGLTQTIEVSSLARNADGTVEAEIPYLKDQSLCLAEGSYVPEIYIDGILVSPADLAAVSLKRFETYRSRFLNLVMCHPAGWKMDSGSWQSPMRIFVGAQNQGSVLLFTFYAPRTRPAAELSDEYRANALKYIFESLPKTPSPNFFMNMAYSALEFHGCNGTVPKGAMPHREWVTSEGFVHVALVFPDTPIEDACSVLNSVTNYYEPNSLAGKN